MARAILIAEKPSLMRAIKETYDTHKSEIPIDIDFLSQAGHLVGLKMPNEVNPAYTKWIMEDLPLNLPYSYRIIPGKNDLVSNIKKAVTSGKYDFVIHAGDPDGEGELLVNLVLAYVGNKLPVKRFWSNDTTSPAILMTLKNLKDDIEFKPFMDAALIRQHIDYTIGINITRAASLKTNVTCQLGRVKAAIIRMIVDRENAIKNYVEKVTYKRAFTYSDCEFINDIEYEELAEALASLPKGNSATVVKVKDEQKSNFAPKLYKLSTFQIDAHSKFGISSAVALERLQNLYEAGIVSYPRTDCEYISSNIDANKILKNIANVIGINSDDLIKRIPVAYSNKNYVNDKAIASEGHTAIIPTGAKCSFPSDSIEGKLYEMIVRRFCAIFSPEKITKSLTVEAEANKEIYTFKYVADIDPGFEFCLNPAYKVRPICPVNFYKDQILNPVKFITKECKTKPPVRYNDGSIIKALDNPEEYKDENNKKVVYSIGTPATRANIIKECINDGYFVIENKHFVPLAKANLVIENFGDLPLFNVNTSGIWEEMFEGIRRGEKNPKEVEQQLLNEALSITLDIKTRSVSTANITKNVSSNSLGECPNCKNQIVSGKFGPYCQGKCGIIVGKYYGRSLTDNQLKSILAGKSVLLKNSGTTKDGTKIDSYITMNGVEDFSYTAQNGTTKTAKQIKYTSKMVFLQK